MRTRLLRLGDWLRARPAWQLVAITVVSAFVSRILSLPFVLIADEKFGRWSAGPDPKTASWAKVVLLALLLAPLLETLVFQMAILRGAAANAYLRSRPWMAIGISAVLFCASHWYSVASMLNTFGAGLILATIFHFSGPPRRAFWVVAVSHACLNGLFTLLARSGVAG